MVVAGRDLGSAGSGRRQASERRAVLRVEHEQRLDRTRGQIHAAGEPIQRGRPRRSGGESAVVCIYVGVQGGAHICRGVQVHGGEARARTAGSSASAKPSRR